MKRVLVCGGTNCVGPYIIKGLLEKKYDITIVTRGNRAIPFANELKHISTDITSEALTKDVVGYSDFDVIIDSVSKDCYSVNNLLCHLLTEKYIQISSMGVYANSGKTVTESDFNPQKYHLDEYMSLDKHSYGEKKKSAEAMAYQRYFNMNPVVIRPGYVVDYKEPFHNQNVRLWELVDWIKRGYAISPKANKNMCSFTLADEEAGLVIDLLDTSFVGSINVAVKHVVTIEEILLRIGQIVGKSVSFNIEGVNPEFRSNRKLDVSLYSRIGRPIVTDVDSWLWSILEEYVKSDYSFKVKWIDLFYDLNN